MKLRMVWLTSLLASAALAQSTPLSPSLSIFRADEPTSSTYTFGVAACNESITLTWSNTLLFQLSSQCSRNDLQIWSTAGTCGDDPGPQDKKYQNVSYLLLDTGSRQGTFSIKISELPDFQMTTSADGGVSLPCNSTTPMTKVHRVCGAVKYAQSNGLGGCNTQTVQKATELELVLDTEPPAVPSISNVTAQDGAARVEFAVGSDTAVVLIEGRFAVDDGGEPEYQTMGEAPATNGFVRAERLQNATEYELRLRARDAAGNVSEPSASVRLKPIRTLGFWEYYKQNGGTDTGGCSAGAGLLPALCALFVSRRARKQVRRVS